MTMLKEIQKTRKWFEAGMTSIVTELICRRMEDMNITRADLASKLGVPPLQIKKMLSKELDMTLRMLGAIAWALDFEIKEECVMNKIK